MSNSKEQPIRSICRSLHVMQAINRHGALTMTQISNATQLPYPTTCRIVATLLSEGVIERETSRKCYRPTALSQSLSCGYKPRTRLVAIARPHIETLTKQIGWPVTIGSRVGSVMVIQDSTHALTTLTFSDYHPGYSLPLTSSAAGLSYLAFSDIEDRENLLNQIESINDDTIYSDLSRVNHESFFELILENGYASFTRNPHTKNPGKASSIALPLHHRDTVIGTMTMVFFSSAMRVNEAYEKYKTELQTAQANINRDLSDVKLFKPEELQLH